MSFITNISNNFCVEKFCQLVTYIDKSSCDEKCHFRFANCVKLLEMSEKKREKEKEKWKKKERKKKIPYDYKL